MADLFLSLTSHDRPWAEPVCSAISGVGSRTSRSFGIRTVTRSQGRPLSARAQGGGEDLHALRRAVVPKGEELDEVGPEIQAFDQHRDDHAQINASKRRLFYVPLDASDYGYLKDVQGSVTIRDGEIYDASPAVADRGVSKLVDEPHRSRSGQDRQ